MSCTCNILYLVNLYLHVLYQTIISYDIYLYISIHSHISIHIHITFFTYHLYIPIACQSFPLHVLCLWHISYLYFYCIPVSILCIRHIHSITYCFSCSITYSFICFCNFIYFYTFHVFIFHACKYQRNGYGTICTKRYYHHCIRQ